MGEETTARPTSLSAGLGKVSLDRDRSEITTELDEMNMLLSDLGSQVSALEDRITPVLSGPVPQKGSDAKNSGRQTSIGSSLMTSNDKLRSLISYIGDLRSRVEI